MCVRVYAYSIYDSLRSLTHQWRFLKGLPSDSQGEAEVKLQETGMATVRSLDAAVLDGPVALAEWLERKALAARRLDWGGVDQSSVVACEAHIAALLQAAATYRLVAATLARS